MTVTHFPVMLSESLEYLAVRPGGVYVDCTAGWGNHTLAIARLVGSGRVVSLDRDKESLALAEVNAAECAGRITFRHSAFSSLTATLNELGLERVDGILADLGVSRVQLTTAARGFSLQNDGPIDMRMDRSQELSAWDLVNRATERELSDLFVEFAEERRTVAQKIARALIRARPLATTAELARVVESCVPRTGKLHPATRVFQALRMAVNDEPGQLDALLDQAPRLLNPGGRLVVIAFQSLDDRKVKTAFRALGQCSEFRVLTRHVVKPSSEETRKNSPSRSAVLRALERITTE